MGLVIVGVLALYLLISIAVVIGAIRFAKNNGKSAKRWGWSAALVMYLIPFWDWIPTVAVHQYYCATEAGFWVYKTPAQWKKENSGIAETLTENKGAISFRKGDIKNYIDTYLLNQRFNWIVKRSNYPLFNLWRHEQEVIDVGANETLARYVDFSTAQIRAGGGWYGWKFWLHNEHCVGGAMNGGRLAVIMESVAMLNKEKNNERNR